MSLSYFVKNYMSKDVLSIDGGRPAVEASKIMKEKNIGQLIVLEKAQPAGIVTEKDLVLKVMALEKDPSKVKVFEIMSAPLITIDPDATLEEAVQLMVKNGIRRLPVVRAGIIYGIFTSRDLAKSFNEYEDKLTRNIIQSMSGLSLPF